MTTVAPVLVEQTYAQKIGHNAEVAFKSGSTWVVVLAGIGATIYAAMTPEQVATLTKSFPWLAGWTPVLGAIAAFVIAKLKPSSNVSTQTKQLVEEIARLRMNEFLRARGAPELPAPPPTPLPIAPPVMPAPPQPPTPAPPVPAGVDFDPSRPALPMDDRLLLSLLRERLDQTRRS